MSRAKHVAIFLLVLFCTQVMLANNGLKELFASERFNTVYPLCQQNNNSEKSNHKLHKTSTAPVVNILINCQENFIGTEDRNDLPLKTLTLAEYFYELGIKPCAVKDQPLPPPKIKKL